MNRNLLYGKWIVLSIILVSISFLALTEAKNIHNCIDLDNHNELVVQQSQTRHLQTISNPHGFRIKFLPSPAVTGVNPAEMNHMFDISAQFFKQLLKVTDVADSTIYTPNYTCGTITTTSTYATSGFSWAQADMIISTQLDSNSQSSYVAYAAPCLLRSWPQYGLIGFNIYFFSADPTKTSQFQSNLLTLLHQVTHILAFHPFFLRGNYRKNYFSSSKIEACETLAVQNGRTFIITPNVRSWAQKHYGCNDQLLGGLVQEEGGSGSAGSHWERAVTLDDFMTASVYPGNKVTQITLNLFKDTGFFYDVDFSLAENIQFGKDKGCKFARGLVSSSQYSPQFCTSNTTLTIFNRLLDFYNFFGGVCSPASFSSRLQVTNPSREYFCFDSQFNTYSQSSINTFGALSRSFQAISTDYSGPHCFQAKCINSNNDIQITVSGTVGTCTKGGSQTISISGTTIYCPSSFDIFCSRQNCINHCGANGYCSQGSCLSNTQCSSIDANCVRCKSTTCTGCGSNLFPTGTASPVCDTCENILPTCTTGCEVTQAGLTICKTITKALDLICYIPPNEEETNVNLGLILGITIPISFCLLMILSFGFVLSFYFIFKKKKNTLTPTDQQVNKEANVNSTYEVNLNNKQEISGENSSQIKKQPQ